ncbi:hypothetical protein C8J57DRAFT_1599931 [Mycena rebaudengoi]|nr:hypothetical protein C8J57DRAFT_1599931 [Mycena rebaudengoi]
MVLQCSSGPGRHKALLYDNRKRLPVRIDYGCSGYFPSGTSNPGFSPDCRPGIRISSAQRACGLKTGLIIQAENTLFLVSRDFLATRSLVFRDMLSLPVLPDSDMMLGCPFDITYFLKALVYYEFFEPLSRATTFDILDSVLRMSHKYDAEALRKRALIHLSSALFVDGKIKD